jgi:hypothetical protein
MTSDGISKIIPMSNANEDGISTVVTTACDMLLAHRVEKKLSSKRIDDIRAQIHVAMPVKRDDKVRGVAIPDSVAVERKAPGMLLHPSSFTIHTRTHIIECNDVYIHFLLAPFVRDIRRHICLSTQTHNSSPTFLVYPPYPLSNIIV